MGTQRFTYAVMPHTGSFQDAGVIQAAYELNNPLRLQQVSLPSSASGDVSFFEIDSKQVILDAIKVVRSLFPITQNHPFSCSINFYCVIG